MMRAFLFFTYIWQKDATIIPKYQGPAQCKSDPKKTWLTGVTIYCAVSNNNSLPLRQFLHDKIALKKNKWGEMLIKQIIEFELKGPEPYM